MYALVEIKGKQYKAEKGSVLKIDKIENVKGDAVDFENVLLIRDDKKVKVGAPFLKNAKIKTTVEEQEKDRKIVVFKYKRRKNYRKKQGHRQQHTIIRVDDIVEA